MLGTVVSHVISVVATGSTPAHLEGWHLLSRASPLLSPCLPVQTSVISP